MAISGDLSRSYDPFKARFRASLKWVFSFAEELEGKASENQDLIVSIENPFILSKRLRVEVRPEIVSLLSDEDLYCRVCCRLFTDDSVTRRSRLSSVLQALSRHGFYVISGDDETPVSEEVLIQKQPFEETAHLALIDALMAAYMKRVVSVEKVVKTVKHFGVFNASKELPFDLEDALLLWTNKVCQHSLKEYLDSILGDVNKLADARQRRRRQKAQADEAKQLEVPVMEDIVKDLSDGRCLGVLINYYRPDILPLRHLSLFDELSGDDVKLNLRLIENACRRIFVDRSFPVSLTANDFSQVSLLLRSNIVTFITQLFDRFVNQVDEQARLHPKNETTRSRAWETSPPAAPAPAALSGLPPFGEAKDHPAYWDHTPLQRPKKPSASFDIIRSSRTFPIPLSSVEPNDVRREATFTRELDGGSISPLQHAPVLKMQDDDEGDVGSEEKLQLDLTPEDRLSSPEAVEKRTPLASSPIVTSEVDVSLPILAGDETERPISPVKRESEDEECMEGTGLVSPLWKDKDPEAPKGKAGFEKEETGDDVVENGPRPASGDCVEEIDAKVVAIVDQEDNLQRGREDGRGDSQPELPVSSKPTPEFLLLKLQLAEKRRNIVEDQKRIEERQKEERRKLGEIAFLQVIRKAKRSKAESCVIPKGNQHEAAVEVPVDSNALPSSAAALVEPSRVTSTSRPVKTAEHETFSSGDEVTKVVKKESKRKEKPIWESDCDKALTTSYDVASPGFGGEKAVGFFVGSWGADADKISQDELERRKVRFCDSRLKQIAQGKALREAETEKKEKSLTHGVVKEEEPAAASSSEMSGQPSPSLSRPSVHKSFGRGQEEKQPKPISKPLAERQRQKTERVSDHPVNRGSDHDSLHPSHSRTDQMTPLRVKLMTKSNRQLVHNAVSHVCLAGVPNRDVKERALQALENSTADHFLVLFRDSIGCKFRALYTFSSESGQVVKTFGKGPKTVKSSMVKTVLKYNSGSRSFQLLHTSAISLTVDAFTIQEHFWQNKQAKRPIHV